MILKFSARASAPVVGYGLAPTIASVQSLGRERVNTTVTRWYCPNYVPTGWDTQDPDRATAEPEDLFVDTAAWLTRLQNIDVLQLFGVSVTNDDGAGVIGRVVDLCLASDTAIALEVGGALGYNVGSGVTCAMSPTVNGQTSADYDLANSIAGIEALGGTVSYLVLDGLFRRTIVNGDNRDNGCNWTSEQSAEANVAYMQRILASRPSMRFVALEDARSPWDGVTGVSSRTYPAQQQPDLDVTLAEFLSQVDAAGIRSSLTGFRFDMAYEDFTGERNNALFGTLDLRDRVSDIHQWCSDRDLGFGLNFSTFYGGRPLPVGSALASDQEHHGRMLQYVTLWRAYREQHTPSLGMGDEFVIISFYYYPRSLEPGHTADDTYNFYDTYAMCLEQLPAAETEPLTSTSLRVSTVAPRPARVTSAPRPRIAAA